MKNNINYFFKQSIRMMLISIPYSAFLAVITYDAGDGLSQLVSVLIFGTAIMNISFHIGMYKKDISLAISFGSTRRNLMLGLIFYDLFSIVLANCVAVILTLMFVESISVWTVVITTTITMLMTSAIGEFMGIVIAKFGKVVAAIIMGTAIIALVVGIGFVTAAVADHGIAWAIMGNGRNITIVLAVVTATVWMVIQFVQSRILCKFTV